ncbi:MAG: hypothetical protein WCX17_03230 [Parcubacteria group bacterium]|jgi:hypothetical protein
MSNLEPIEEADLDVKNKFTGNIENPAKPAFENKKEAEPFALEKLPEIRAEGAAEKDQVYTQILSKVKTAVPHDDNSVASDAQDISVAQGEEAKIETLIKLATTKGVAHAVKVARHLEDNYALDEFHDRLLASELHNALLKKGLIKEF